MAAALFSISVTNSTFALANRVRPGYALARSSSIPTMIAPHYRQLTGGGSIIPGARRLAAKVGFVPVGNPVQVLAERLGVVVPAIGRTSLRARNRQAEGDQR